MTHKVIEEEKVVHPRLFRLLETHQRIDERLRAAQRQVAPERSDLDRLLQLKAKAKLLIARLTQSPSVAVA